MIAVAAFALILLPIIVAQTCGGGQIGDGRCSDGLCCSAYGYCGSTSVYCAGYCGNGVVGSGRCADASCCSKYGYCGNTSVYCDNPTDTGPKGKRESRMIAYLGDWQPCPSAASLEHYTHVILAFATTYTYDSNSNQVCSPTCQVYPTATCNNLANPGLIADLQRAGKKVLLSFGGGNQGGTWDPPPNGCWEYCYGKEEQVSNQLVAIVQSMRLDGIDIDYEYYADNTQGFTKAQEAQYFLKQTSLLLRQKLPPQAILVHAPMDDSIIVDTGYYSVLQQIASILDWIQPQYYTGYTNPVKDGLTGGTHPTIDHYNDLVDLFQGSALNIVFGFCPSCTPGPTGSEAAGL